MERYRPPLHVHVVYASGHPAGPAFAERLTRWLCGDPAAAAIPEADLPVFAWSGGDDAPPPDIPWGEAARTALLLLIDDNLVASAAWRAWAARQLAAARRPRDLILPCTITPRFANLGAGYAGLHAIRLDRIDEGEREEDLVLFATHALARWFGNDPGAAAARAVRLFISHANAAHLGLSGRDLALALKRFIEARPAGEVFFDEVGITGGDEFATTLAAAIEQAVVVVLLTDRFSSRYWCGWEVLTAKEKGRPLLVVDALAEGEATSLAYLGNTRTMRWDAARAEARDDPGAARRIVAGALLELLRRDHDAARLAAVRAVLPADATAHIVGRRPELATLPAPAAGGARTVLLHPDPPLPRYERTLLRRHRPDLEPVSVTQALAGCLAGSGSGSGTGTGATLAGRRIAISISDSPDAAANGLGPAAQARLWTRLATHLLAAGAELAYGGDLRVGGYTERLLDLARSAADAGAPLPEGIVHWYVGWPVAARLSTEERAAIPPAFRLHLGAPPAGIDPALRAAPPPANDFVPEHHFAWTLALAEMRRAMAGDCHARILVGGQLRAVSPWPGLLEELETCAGKPTYLIGAFGGMTRVLIRALRGETPEELEQEFQDEGGKRASLREHYEARAGVVGLAKRVEALNQRGVAGLGNGLSPAENERLFVTRDLTEMIALVLHGLRVTSGG